MAGVGKTLNVLIVLGITHTYIHTRRRKNTEEYFKKQSTKHNKLTTKILAGYVKILNDLIILLGLTHTHGRNETEGDIWKTVEHPTKHDWC